MANDAHIPAETIAQWRELSDYLFDLATIIHEHSEMLFRLSDNAKAEAEKLLRQQIA